MRGSRVSAERQAPIRIGMTVTRRTLRNILSVGGAYYLATWLVAPFWFLVTPWMNRGHPMWLSALVALIPAVIACAVAGVAAGFAVESQKPLAWALALGGLVALLRWFGWRWQLPPDLGDRTRQAIDAALPAAIAIAGVLFARQYADRQSRSPNVGA